MFRSTILLLFAALLLGFGFETVSAQAQEIPEEMQVNQLPRQRLAGPRFGFTTFTGDVADLRQQAGLESIMSQFGWQFETQIVSTTSGNQALMEWVVLVGGVAQDDLNVSLSWLAGYRLPNGFEFGVGPNVNVNQRDWGEANTSMVIAGGATIPFGELYVPLNVAMSFAQGGPRITTLIGWLIG